MKASKEEQLLADLYNNLKGSKIKHENWIEIAKKSQKLVQHYGSISATAEKLGVSYQLIRTILRLLKLPDEIQQLVKEKKILYDAAHRILTIKDPQDQVKVAIAIAGLPSHKQREIIQYARKYPDSGLNEYIERVTRPKTKPEKIHIAVIPLREEMYKSLQVLSKMQKISVQKLILNVVEQWLGKRSV